MVTLEGQHAATRLVAPQRPQSLLLFSSVSHRKLVTAATDTAVAPFHFWHCFTIRRLKLELTHYIISCTQSALGHRVEQLVISNRFYVRKTPNFVASIRDRRENLLVIVPRIFSSPTIHPIWLRVTAETSPQVFFFVFRFPVRWSFE